MPTFSVVMYGWQAKCPSNGWANKHWIKCPVVKAREVQGMWSSDVHFIPCKKAREHWVIRFLVCPGLMVEAKECY